MRDIPSVLLSNEEIATDFFHARIANPFVARSAVPGQFLQLNVTDQLSPFLRIPLSISGVDPSSGVVEVLYEVMGPKSHTLSRARTGDVLHCLGPLGNGFDPPNAGRLILVGGGIGVPPLLFLGHRAQTNGSQVVLLIGARTANKLLPDEFFKPAAQRYLVATNDGTAGHSGMVTDLISAQIDSSADCVVCTCGPHGMMVQVAEICREAAIPCQVSLEEYMACGFGVCVGCVVEIAADDGLPSAYAKYSRVCVDGPVFEADRVIWRST